MDPVEEGNNEYIKPDHALNRWSASHSGLPAVSAKSCVVLRCSHIPRLLQLEDKRVRQHLGVSIKIHPYSLTW